MDFGFVGESATEGAGGDAGCCLRVGAGAGGIETETVDALLWIGDALSSLMDCNVCIPRARNLLRIALQLPPPRGSLAAGEDAVWV